MKEFYTIAGIARKLGITRAKAVSLARFIKPSIVNIVNDYKKRYWAEYQIDDFKKFLINPPWRNKNNTRQALADHIGISRIALTWHENKKNIPAPTLGTGKTKRYYSEEQIETIIAFFKKYTEIKNTMYLLGPGLSKIGATHNEYCYIYNYVELPEPLVIGNNMRNKFYTLEQLKTLLDNFRNGKV